MKIVVLILLIYSKVNTHFSSTNEAIYGFQEELNLVFVQTIFFNAAGGTHKVKYLRQMTIFYKE